MGAEEVMTDRALYDEYRRVRDQIASGEPVSVAAAGAVIGMVEYERGLSWRQRLQYRLARVMKASPRG